MFNSNSNPDVFLSQPWSQLDSQDFGFPISGSQEFNQNVSLTSSGGVLPPTPSATGVLANRFSNGWSRRNNNPMTPQSQTHIPVSSGALVRETIFSREIRYALHAVLTVVKELPEKLKEAVAKLLDSRKRIDHELIEKVKLTLTEKIPNLESVITFCNKNEAFLTDQKNMIEVLKTEMEDFKKVVNSQNEDLVALTSRLDSNNEFVRNQLKVLRRSYLSESRKVRDMLSHISNKLSEQCESGQQSETILKEIQGANEQIVSKNNALSNLLDSKTEEVKKDMVLLRNSVDNIPALIDSSVKQAVKENIQNHRPSFIKNVRNSSNDMPANFSNQRKCDKFSPVARVTPRIKKEPFGTINFGFPPFEPSQKRKMTGRSQDTMSESSTDVESPSIIVQGSLNNFKIRCNNNPISNDLKSEHFCNLSKYTNQEQSGPGKAQLPPNASDENGIHYPGPVEPRLARITYNRNDNIFPSVGNEREVNFPLRRFGNKSRPFFLS